MTATLSNPDGYFINFCYRCTTINIGADPREEYFDFDDVTISQQPENCTESLEKRSFVSPSIPYNHTGVNELIVTNYSKIFEYSDRVIKEYCPVSFC